MKNSKIYKIYAFLLSLAMVCICLSAYADEDDHAVERKEHRKEAWRNFFSLRQQDSIKEFVHISTSDDYKRKAEEENSWTLKWGGYISQDFIFDSRQSAVAREGIIAMYPLNAVYDKNGKDINARPSWNLLAMNTRLTARIHAPKALGANISGMIEGWFVGVSNSDANGFCLRHAIIDMQWKSTRLLMGQTWHPLFTQNCFPYTVSGSAGAPFQAFARSPQIRLTQSIKDNNIMLYINSQRDYASIGFGGVSSEYLRNSAIPEAGLQYYWDHSYSTDSIHKQTILLGIGGDYKYLIPRMLTADSLYTRHGVHSWAVIAYMHYSKECKNNVKTGIKLKAMYAQGMNDFLAMGGYAVQYYNAMALSQAEDYNYVGINNVSAWIDWYANIKSWEVALFAGYSQNLGAWKNIQDWNNAQSYYMKDYNVKYLYRVCARMKYTANHIQFALEPEYTVAAYGNCRNSLGVVQAKPSADYPQAGLKVVGDFRVLFTTTLFF